MAGKTSSANDGDTPLQSTRAGLSLSSAVQPFKAMNMTEVNAIRTKALVVRVSMVTMAHSAP
jgi:hypothetical protein